MAPCQPSPPLLLVLLLPAHNFVKCCRSCPSNSFESEWPG
jgi:hypothetical protein